MKSIKKIDLIEPLSQFTEDARVYVDAPPNGSDADLHAANKHFVGISSALEDIDGIEIEGCETAEELKKIIEKYKTAIDLIKNCENDFGSYWDDIYKPENAEHYTFYAIGVERKGNDILIICDK